MLMRTAAEYIALMKHGITANPSPMLLAGGGLWGILNDAGRSLYNAPEAPPYNHTWTWRHRQSVTLNIPADVSEVLLPDDFGEEVSCRINGSGWIVMEELGRINELAAANVGGGSGTLYICFEAGLRQATPTQATRKLAAIWPQQATARSDVLLTYAAQWRELSESRPSEIPAIPSDFERLLLLMARDQAWALQNQRPSHESSEFVTELQRLIGVDSRKQSTIGRPVHSVMGRASQRSQKYRQGGYGDVTTNEITRA